MVSVNLSNFQQLIENKTNIMWFKKNDYQYRVIVMVFNAPFNNISVISWRSVLLVEESGVSRENHRPEASYWQTLSHNIVSSTPRLSRISNSQQ